MVGNGVLVAKMDASGSFKLNCGLLSLWTDDTSKRSLKSCPT